MKEAGSHSRRHHGAQSKTQLQQREHPCDAREAGHDLDLVGKIETLCRLQTGREAQEHDADRPSGACDHSHVDEWPRQLRPQAEESRTERCEDRGHEKQRSAHTCQVCESGVNRAVEGVPLAECAVVGNVLHQGRPHAHIEQAEVLNDAEDKCPEPVRLVAEPPDHERHDEHGHAEIDRDRCPRPQDVRGQIRPAGGLALRHRRDFPARAAS